ncbi:MAG TPA: nitroreductase family protein [bacterium]|nr:nitroreductase family protein [bacterium]
MDVYDAIRTRRSVREYAAGPVPADTVVRLVDALRLAPSAVNAQPWRFIIVADQAAKESLVPACKGRQWIASAALIVVACGFPEKAYKAMGGSRNSVDIDCAIALDHLSLAARSEGIGTCWIGAFDEVAVKRTLKIPAEAQIVSMMTVGYPAKAGAFRAAEGLRKSRDEIVSYNTY